MRCFNRMHIDSKNSKTTLKYLGDIFDQSEVCLREGCEFIVGNEAISICINFRHHSCGFVCFYCAKSFQSIS